MDGCYTTVGIFAASAPSLGAAIDIARRRDGISRVFVDDLTYEKMMLHLR